MRRVDKELVSQLAELSKDKLSQQDKVEIGDNLYREMTNRTTRRRRKNAHLWLPTGAAAAAVALCIGGVYVILSQHGGLLGLHNQPSQGGPTSQNQQRGHETPPAKTQSATKGHPSAPTRPSVKTHSSPPAKFPALVKKAMKQFPSRILTKAEAVTELPAPSNTLSYRTWDFKTGPILGYNVMLQSAGKRIAMFSGSTYESSSMASGSVSLPQNLTAGGKSTTSSIHLQTGKTAKGFVFNIGPNAKETSFADINWTNGNWKIQVTSNQSTKLPVNAANRFLKDLKTVALPAGVTKGTILINVEPGQSANISTYIKWQKGKHVYEVDTYASCQNPIKTAMAMTMSMKPYS